MDLGLIVDAAEPVVLLGGGEVDKADLDEAMSHASALVAADGAAATALGFGYLPDAVIGDFDSIDDGTRSRIPKERLHHIADQDTTDFDKCLGSIHSHLVLGVGFMGARLDHELAVYNALVRRHEQRCVLIGSQDLVFVAPPELRVDLAKGTRFSLFPMGPVTGRSEGLRWPISGLEFRPDGRVGTSNEVTGPVRLEMDAPNMLVITPREVLGPVLSALLG